MSDEKITTKEKSSVPMIMGIIGGVIGLPAAVCAGACVAGLSSFSETTQDASELGSFYLWMGVLGAVFGLYAGMIGKSKPKFSGIVFLLATFMSGITMIAGNMLALIVVILFLIGAAFAFKNSKN